MFVQTISFTALSFKWCCFLQLIVLSSIHEQNFGSRKIVWPMGNGGRKKLLQCRVRGTSAPGWPNAKHSRLPIRKPLKPPTVNRKNCRNIKIVLVSTYALQGWKAWISSSVAASAVVECCDVINYSLTENCYIHLTDGIISVKLQ